MLSVFLMPNVAFIIGLPNVIDPMAKIGVEEQFSFDTATSVKD